MQASELRSAGESSSEYHLMHKHLVGPRTVGRLLLHYTELTQAQSVERLYEAGWAAAEAALVATPETIGTSRTEMLAMAGDAWQYSKELAYERTRGRAQPCYDRAIRIETSQAVLPVFEAITTGTFTTPVRAAYHDTLLDISSRTASLLEHSIDNGKLHTGNYKGLNVEQLSILGLSRELSGRLVAMPSLARSDSGVHYPRETHDIQVLSHARGKRHAITPMEIKFRHSPSRYNAPVLTARTHLGTHTVSDVVALCRLYEKDFRQPELMTEEETARLDAIKTTLVGLIGTYRRKQMSRPSLDAA